MAVGKNKRLAKSKKGPKKRTADVMTKKDWYDVKAPTYFTQRQLGKTCVTRTTGTKIASDGLKGRVFEVCLADLNADESTHRKIKLSAEDVQGKNVLTNFHGMDLTTDKLRSLVKKWQTLIEAFVDIKTADGYVLRLFCIGFTKKHKTQIKKTSYAQSSQIRQIRQAMINVMEAEARNTDLKDFVLKLIPESISAKITKACQGIYPLHDVFIRKVKVTKKPKFDAARLMEIHGEVSSDGSKVGREGTFKEPAPLAEV